MTTVKVQVFLRVEELTIVALVLGEEELGSNRDFLLLSVNAVRVMVKGKLFLTLV